LVYNHEEVENPLDTEAVLVSHAHPDHSSDAEPIIEMMTEGANKPGAVFANETVFHGYGEIEKTVSNYHRDLCVKVEQLEQGTETSFKDLSIESQEMFHGDPRTVGIILEDDEHRIGFWTDSEYSEELLDFYEGCDVMVIYCTRPRNKSIASHTSIDDAAEILETLDPNTAIITHFGKAFLNSDLEDEENWLDENTDCKIIFAEDGMNFPGNRSLMDF
jgi:ribonuclease BN (tRNA processing enzyme)